MRMWRTRLFWAFLAIISIIGLFSITDTFHYLGILITPTIVFLGILGYAGLGIIIVVGIFGAAFPEILPIERVEEPPGEEVPAK